MPDPAAEGVSGWLTLQEACERLDVHPTTLRQWADRGKLRTFRTPGGHRRFAADDVDALLTALPLERSAELDLLLDAALGRARREIGAGRPSGEGWYRLLPPQDRERFRQLGRRLLQLLVRSVDGGGDQDAVLADARRDAREQGRIARDLHLTLEEAVRAHAFFRGLVVETVLQIKAVQEQGRPAPDLVVAYRQAAAFLDELLIAYLDAFTEAGS